VSQRERDSNDSYIYFITFCRRKCKQANAFASVLDGLVKGCEQGFGGIRLLLKTSELTLGHSLLSRDPSRTLYQSTEIQEKARKGMVFNFPVALQF
jgi:hypothetical protein